MTQLDFFDHLEQRPVTTWDEMLAGLLLVTNKRANGDYTSRLAQARGFGYVGPDAPLKADTPVTPAAFARAAMRAQGARLNPNASSDDLVVLAQQRGLLPGGVKGNDILDGATMVQGLAVVGEPSGMSRGLANRAMGTPERLPRVDVTETKLSRSETTVPIVAAPKLPGAVTPRPKVPPSPPADEETSASKFEEFETPSKPNPTPPSAPKPPAPSPTPVPEEEKKVPDPNLPQPRPEPLPK